MTVLYVPSTSGSSRLRLGVVAGMAVLAIGAALWLKPDHRHAAVPATKIAVARVMVRNAAPRPVKPAGPAKPSVFAQEAAMRPKAMMARWEPVIAQASKRFKVPADWIRAVIHMESGGRTMLGENLPITSSVGAVGIMQVMPQTYAELRGPLRLGPDAYDPHDNVMAGTAYLKWLSGKYGNPGMFAAYNDGPGNWEAFMADQHALPAETNAYVAGIARMIGGPALDNVTKAQLTRPDGTAITVDAVSVSAVRAPLPGEYADSVQAVVSAGRMHQGVRETVAVAMARLKAHGARL